MKKSSFKQLSLFKYSTFNDVIIDTQNLDFKIKLVISKTQLEELYTKIVSFERVALDIETTGLNPITDKIVGVSMTCDGQEGFFISLIHRYISEDEVYNLLKLILENPVINTIGHNLSFDLAFIKAKGIDIRCSLFDTYIIAKLLDEKQCGLKELVKKHFNISMLHYEDVVKKGTEIEDVSIEKLAEYSVADCIYTYRLWNYFQDKIADLEPIFSIETELIHNIVNLKLEGVRVDKSSLEVINNELEEKIKSVSEDIFKCAGVEFNINSQGQLAGILFDKLQLPQIDGRSTSEVVLKRLKNKHKIISLVQEYRKISKLHNAYTNRLLKEYDENRGKIFPDYNQIGAVTGRISSNIQQIPRGELIRQSIIAEDGFFIVDADYNQIEVRLLASISSDTNLKQAFLKNEDIHSKTASQIFKIPIDSVTKEQRQSAKKINFALCYGMTSHGLASSLDIPLKEAENYIELYFQLYPGFKQYQENAIQIGRSHKYVKTILGRKIYLHGIDSEDFLIRSTAERLAINGPIQGSAADLIKLAIIKVNKALRIYNTAVKLILTIHDELVYQVRKELVSEVVPIIKKVMENVVNGLDVPLIVDIEIGENWADLKKWENNV